MKKAPHKLPLEIHDPKPEVPMCVDLSDCAPPPLETPISARPGPAAEL